MKKSLFCRFLNKFQANENNCWIWNGTKHEFGYGKIGVDGKMLKAHRVSWFLFKGQIPASLCVLHKCDNPACVNPDHLFLGTLKDNTRDMIRKGRDAACGERNHESKLSPAQVAEIIALRKEGVMLKYISAQFGISMGHVSQIASGGRWGHVERDRDK